MSLRIPARSRGDFALAKAYLRRDPEIRGIFARLEHSHRSFEIRTNSRGDDHFDPNTNKSAWDPYSALRTTQGGRQSPALGLAHELAHAAERPDREAALSAHSIARYDTAEERRVIRGPERRAASILGEANRCDHRGSIYRVATPVSR